MQITKILTLLLLLICTTLVHSAEYEPYLEYGRTTVNSHNSHAGFGFYVNDKWDYNISITGQGNTKNGKQQPSYLYAISRIFKTKVDLYGKDVKVRLGLAHTENMNLIGKYNFKLGIILEGKVAGLEIFHYSSGGVYKPNTGLDGVKLRIKL